MSHFDNIGPVATISDCAYEMGISPQALHYRLKLHQTLTKPDTFRAGGSEVLIKDNARIWCEKHKREWDALQAAKKGGE